MTDGNPTSTDHDLEDVAKTDPASKRGNSGQAAHGGDQAGPSSDDAGRPLSPQTGDPHSDGRQG
jgi:hypothetical protein